MRGAESDNAGAVPQQSSIEGVLIPPVRRGCYDLAQCTRQEGSAGGPPSTASNCVTQGTPGRTDLQIVGKKVIIGC